MSFGSFRVIKLAVFLLFGLCASGSQALELSVKDAETVAIQNDPLIVKAQAREQAFMEDAVADAQLPDPRLRLGMANLPLDSFKLTQEPMTQIVVGVQQMIPPQGVLGQKADQSRLQAEVERAEAMDRAFFVLRNVRKAWMEVYFQSQSLDLVKESADIFDQLVRITQYQYRAGRGQQHEVVRAQLELSLLRDREQGIIQQREVAIAELEKWVGASVRNHTLSKMFPEMPTLPTYEELSENVEFHPSLAVKKAQLGASRKMVGIAKAQFKPEWAVDVSYGYRGTAQMDDGSGTGSVTKVNRADLFSAVVSMNMPFFTEKRQNRRLNARGHEVNAASDAVDAQRRELQRLLDTSFAAWKQLGERLEFYKSTVLPQAAQYAETTRKAYQSRTSDFAELVRARLRELDSNLQTLRLRIDRAKVHYDLQYLAGEA